MPYTTIMVLLDGGRRAYHRLAVAARLAVHHDAVLIGMLAAPARADRDGTPLASSEADRKPWQESAEVMRHAFHGETEELPITAEWRQCEGSALALVQGEARLADLLVVGQQEEDDAPRWLPRGFVEAMILGSGRPVLVIPGHGWFQAVGSRVLVAWNGSREAARAIRDALPLLQRAQSVTLVSCAESDERAAAGPHRATGGPVPPAQYPLAWLERHGVAAEATTLAHVAGADVGERLLSLAADRDMDLIVAGAYGHSRARELVLGGVTRTLLRAMTVPVLFSH